MNLLDVVNGLDFFEQMDAEFIVVNHFVECYYCRSKATTSAYEGHNAGILMNARFPEDKLAAVHVEDYYVVDDYLYIVATKRGLSTYHCAKCKNGPAPISDADMNQYKIWMMEAAKLVREDLGIEKFKMHVYNKRDNRGGYFNESKNPNGIFLNIGTISEFSDIRREIYKAVAHEARHLWQYQQGWVFDYSKEYREREHEIDAFDYQDKFEEKFLMTSV